METVIIDDEQNAVCFTCPWCEIMISVELNQINCKIFRCGIHKDSLKQIDPHLEKTECNKLVQDGKIYGCGKPFQYVDSDPPKVVKCDYL